HERDGKTQEESNQGVACKELRPEGMSHGRRGWARARRAPNPTQNKCRASRDQAYLLFQSWDSIVVMSPCGQFEPQAEDHFSRHGFHVARAAIGLVVFPHQQTRGKGAQAPSRFMGESDMGMVLVVDIERLKKLTESCDGWVPLHGAPSVGGTECHFARDPSVHAKS